jgi:hypothetical protein
MRAKDYNGTIKVYNKVPKSYGSIIGGFDLLSDSDLEEHGFYDVVLPTFDNRIKELGDIYFDSTNSQFTYPVNNRTWTETLSELKTAKIKEVKSIYNTLLSETDWYVIRKQEKGTAIPSDVQANRDALRAACSTHETDINAKTNKAQVESYDLSNI